MATEVETLLLRLEATQAKFEKQMKAAYNSADRNSRRIESRFARMNKSVGGSFSALQGVMIKAFAAAAAARGAQQLIDSATRIENALKVAGLAGTELTKVYDQLFQSAQRNAAPLEALVTLYGRAALVQKELGISQQELLGFTDKVALSLRVSGKSAAESSGALLQLSQALGSGIVRAEEFNSILEGALPIAQAAAAGLEEAGGSVSKLRQLVVDGKISSEAFFRAFEAGSVILEEKVAGSTFTISQQFDRLQNSLIKAADKFSKATGAGADFGEAIGNLALMIDKVDISGLVDQINGYIMAADQAAVSTQNFLREIGKASGLSSVGEFLTNNKYANALGIYSGDAIERRMGANGATSSDPALAAALASRFGGQRTTQTTGRIQPSASVNTVSLRDLAAPVSTKSGGRGGGSKRENDFAREVAQIRERTAALQTELQVMSGLNPRIDDYGFALEKARAAQELTLAAQKAGMQITPELTASINELAGSYAQASVDAEMLAESQDKARQAAEDMKALGKDVMSGFISDLRQGKSASEALAGALQKVADKLLDVALNSLFDGGGVGGLFGGGGRRGGLLGGFLIPGILHSGGVAGSDGYGHGRAVSPSVFAGAKRYHSGGIAGMQPGEVPAILQKGEIVIPKNAKALNGDNNGYISVSVQTEVVNGNLVPVIATVAGQVAGKQIRQANRGLQGRLQAVQTRGQ
jgi:tape measure domain-containing protein